MRKAFLVGINKYTDGNNLQGCVNDTLLLYKILSEKFFFETKNIDIITDDKCTKKNILEGLRKLTSNSSVNDTLFFHYSGHGSQVVSNDWTKSSEADGRDEILCPFDLDWDDPLRDNDLNNIFAPLKCNSVVILDSCHSGSGLRNSSINSKSRFLPPPIDNMLSNPMITLDNDLRYIFPEPNSNLQTQLKKFSVITNSQGNTVLISGCKENQTSADAYIGNRYHGALTFNLYQALSNASYKISFSNLIIEINRLIKNSGFEQIPQLECSDSIKNNYFLM